MLKRVKVFVAGAAVIGGSLAAGLTAAAPAGASSLPSGTAPKVVQKATECDPWSGWCQSAMYPNEAQCVAAKNALEAQNYQVDPEGAKCNGNSPNQRFFWYTVLIF